MTAIEGALIQERFVTPTPHHCLPESQPCELQIFFRYNMHSFKLSEDFNT